MSDKLKNIWKDITTKTKDYTTIEPTAKNQGSATGWITGSSDTLRKIHNKLINYARDQEPTMTKLKTEEIDAKAMGLSTHGSVRYFQKKFTKKGKKAVEDLKLKSLKK